MPREDLVDIRGGTVTEWTAANPVLAENEIAAVHADSGSDYWLVVGDGATPAPDLPRAGTRLEQPRPSVHRALEHTMLVDPTDDATNGIIFERPSATAGDSGTENAWIVLDDTAADAPAGTLARMDWAGGLGCQSIHASPRVGSTATQALWVDPAEDVVGMVVDTSGSPSTQDMILGRWANGTTRFRVNAGGAVLASGAYVFATDDNTGMVYSASDTFVLQAGGSPVLTIQRTAGGVNRIGAFTKAGTPAGQQTVTGSRGGNAALASLLTALANLGFIDNQTTA